MTKDKERRRQQQKEADERYREKYPARLKARRKRWRAKNKKHTRQYDATRRKKRLTWMQKWRDDNPQQAKMYSASSHLKIKFGISLGEYKALLEIQNGACAICRTTDLGKSTRGEGKRLFFCVDHDHDTKHVRGLLCHHCNAGLGHFRDDPTRLRTAIQYLQGDPFYN